MTSGATTKHLGVVHIGRFPIRIRRMACAAQIGTGDMRCRLTLRISPIMTVRTFFCTDLGGAVIELGWDPTRSRVANIACLGRRYVGL